MVYDRLTISHLLAELAQLGAGAWVYKEVPLLTPGQIFTARFLETRLGLRRRWCSWRGQRRARVASEGCEEHVGGVEAVLTILTA